MSLRCPCSFGMTGRPRIARRQPPGGLSWRPDALWIARYDGVASLSGWAGIPDSDWAVNQRAKQYRNSHNETYGGVTINIDNDRVDAPVATVGYGYRVTSSTPLNSRSGPSTSYPVVRAHQP